MSSKRFVDTTQLGLTTGSAGATQRSTKSSDKVGSSIKIGDPRKKMKTPKSSFEWLDLLKAMAVSMGAILIYGLVTNIALLTNGIYTPDPVAHNLAYIISAIVSGGIFAFATFNYIEHLAAYTSPVDSILSWFHDRPDTTVWYVLARLAGQLAGAFVMVGTLYLIFQDKDRVKLAANVVNPLSIATNNNAFTALSLETIGTVVLALVVFTLDAQHRSASDRALIKGFVMAVLRLAVFQYTTGSFNFFIAFAMDICSGQWNTFSGGTWYIFPLSMFIGLIISGLIIILQRKIARALDEKRKDHFAKVNFKVEESSSGDKTDYR